jgi:hypothetical protein
VGIERRKHTRIACQIPCEIRGSGKPVAGTTREVSMGGLSIQAELEAEQGDILQVLLKPPRREPVPIEAIVWHARRVRQRQSGKTSNRLGLILSEAPEDFPDLLTLRGTAPKVSEPEIETEPEPLRELPGEPEPSPAEPPPTPLEEPVRYRVRVTLSGSSRTRSILVFADDDEEARKNSLAETGPDWHVLEIERA